MAIFADSFLPSSSVLLTTIFSVLVAYVFWILSSERRRAKCYSGIPGPARVPVFGNALTLMNRDKLMSQLLEWQDVYGPRYLIKIGHSWRILIANPKDLEVTMKSQAEITKTVEYDRMKRWLGIGLLTSTGETWTKRRKMLTPAFHFKILEEFIDVFNSQTDVFVDVLKKKCSEEQVFDIFPLIAACTLDIICESAMGTKVNAQIDTNSPYTRAIYRLTDLQMHRAMRPWLYSNFLWNLSPSGRDETACLKIVHEFAHNVIRERKSDLSSGKLTSQKTEGKRKLAFLDLLIEAQKNPDNNLSDEDIRAEVDTFMFEGNDTTAASASFAVFLLASHPEIQKNLQAELDNIFQDDLTRPMTSEDLLQMKYLDCCLKESLRIYPSVPMIGRKLQAEFQLDSLTKLPKGTDLVASPYLLHRDPKVFPEPEKFIPERFLPENADGRNPFAYLPFSAGPRNCIGQKFAVMEEKILLANIFRNFKIEACERKEDLIIMFDIVTRSKSGIQVKLTPRF